MEERETRSARLNVSLPPSLYEKVKKERDKRSAVYSKISLNDLVIEALLSQPWAKDQDK